MVSTRFAKVPNRMVTDGSVSEHSGKKAVRNNDRLVDRIRTFSESIEYVDD